MLRQLLQFRVLRLGLLQDGDVRVGIFPQCQDLDALGVMANLKGSDFIVEDPSGSTGGHIAGRISSHQRPVPTSVSL
jgi:hypothetical protein